VIVLTWGKRVVRNDIIVWYNNRRANAVMVISHLDIVERDTLV